MTRSSTTAFTIFPNAPPMMTPTARSTTLPLNANSLKSFSMDGWYHRAQPERRGPMIDHCGVKVSDPVKSRTFYDKALAPLGYEVLREIPKQFTGGLVILGYGVAPKPDFWVAQGQPREKVHVAFRAADRAQVDAFHRAALAAGGTDNGAPGARPHYHEHYYGAFVLDPDGHNIEAV